jgi:hypothetical protein
LHELTTIVAEDEEEVLVFGRFDALDLQSSRRLWTHHPSREYQAARKHDESDLAQHIHSLLCYAPSRAQGFMACPGGSLNRGEFVEHIPHSFPLSLLGCVSDSYPVQFVASI